MYISKYKYTYIFNYACMHCVLLSPLLTVFDGVLLNHHARCSVCYQMKCILLIFNLVDSYNSFNSCQFENMSYVSMYCTYICIYLLMRE